MAATVNGVLVIDKPRGLTSHDVVARARRILKTREIGHAGTLDPMATGVLVLAVGEATKLVPYLTSEEKAYDAEITFGRATDTLDAEGETTAEGPVPADLTVRLEAALVAERSRTEQVPPAYSAIHADGERAHVRARRGEVVTLPPRAVRVIELVLTASTEHTASLGLRVTKGYYVRSLARDLGDRIGVPSHLSALRRTASGSFTLAGASALDAPDLATHLLPLAEAAKRALPSATLSERGLVDARCGRPVRLEDFSARTDGPTAWLSPSGALVAIGQVDGEVARVLRGFAAPS